MLRDQCVLAGAHQAAATKPETRPAAFEGEPLRRGFDVHLNRHRAENVGGNAGQQRQPERHTRATQSRRAARDRGRGCAIERHRLDRLLLATGARDRRSLGDDGRRRGIVCGARNDFEQPGGAVNLQAQPPAADVEHVAVAQPSRARDARAVVQHRLVRGRLQEQLPVLHTDPGERSRGAGRHDDVAAGAPDRDRQLRVGQQTLAQRLADGQLRAQMGSSQRIVTAGGACPGSTVSSRRTSRNPVRVPTIVYRPGSSSMSLRSNWPIRPTR